MRASPPMPRSTGTHSTKPGKRPRRPGASWPARRPHMTTYRPYPLAVAQDDQGRWQVVISVSPWQRASVTVVVQGITPARAVELALDALPVILGKGHTP
jgi:hypothetical protein